ncbi:MAG: FtsW/RodA/SpoVE family cell cycle protein, partial [Lactobacillus iners]|nr:FtsW/RodA/SpoVE family cell cycle protein [Lactobacillus iners]
MAKVENKSDWFDRVAWGIVLSVFTLALISLYAIWVAASNDPNLGRPKYIVAVQGLWYVVSIAIVIFIMRFDSEQLFKLAPYAYATGIILLIAVLFLYNRSTFNETGAKSWFKLGPLTFQPSEVMKPAFILMLARVVNQHNLRFEHQIKSDWQLIG